MEKKENRIHQPDDPFEGPPSCTPEATVKVEPEKSNDNENTKSNEVPINTKSERKIATRI